MSYERRLGASLVKMSEEMIVIGFELANKPKSILVGRNNKSANHL